MAVFSTKHTNLLIYISLLIFNLSACDQTEQHLTTSNQATQTNEPIKKVVVYSARKEHLIKPLFDQYTQQTGVQIDYITDKAGPLLARLAAEGARTPADLLITVDAGNLWHAAEQGLLRSIDSTYLDTHVPTHLKDSQNRWFGLSLRARTIVYSSERVNRENLNTYQALAEPTFHKRLCLRTAKKVYNQSLVASFLARQGESETETLIKGWVNNLAADVFSSDTLLLKAIIGGQCDVGIVNTYYLGRLLKKDKNLPIDLFWANQTSTGTHVNVSGAGVTTHAKHPKEALALIEWLASKTAQKQFAALNLEFPVIEGVVVEPTIAAWGTFKQDTLPMEQLGFNQANAIRLMDRAGYF